MYALSLPRSSSISTNSCFRLKNFVGVGARSTAALPSSGGACIIFILTTVLTTFAVRYKGTVRWVSLRLALLPFHSIDYFEKQDVTVLSLYHPFFIPACAHSGSLREFPRLQLPRVRVFSHTYILYILLTLIYITPFFLLSHHFNTGLHPAQNRGLPRSRSKERSRASGRQHRSTILAWYVRRRLFNFHIIL